MVPRAPCVTIPARPAMAKRYEEFCSNYYDHSSSTGAFQKWADEAGDQSYTFNNLLPLFRNSIHFNPSTTPAIPSNVSIPYRPEDLSSTGGQLQVSFPAYFNTISSWLGNAFEELRFARLPGFFDGRLFGWSYFPYTVDSSSQTRSSSESPSCVKPLRETTNLNFYKSTLATSSPSRIFQMDLSPLLRAETLTMHSDLLAGRGIPDT